jgi:hypothetical protein
MLAGVILPHPTAQSVLGTALHVFLRNALRTAAFPTLGLSLPGGIATFRAPAFRHAWWLALGWSLAEVAAGVAQGYETLTLYRDALIPEGRAREIVTSAVTAPAWELKNNRNESSSPPRAADERLRESLSRGEDGGMSMDISGSPVRGRRLEPSFTSIQIGNDAETQLEVDRDFDELVAVKAREELEDLYGFAPIVSLKLVDEGSVIDSNFLEIAARARLRLVFAARRVDIVVPRLCPTPLSGVPHLAPRLASCCRRYDDSTIMV